MRFYFRINVEDQDGMHLLKIWFSFPEHSGGGLPVVVASLHSFDWLY